ncbi:MAG: response regulator [Anaerolineae bacterium]|nr:response regulator [Anaerolineae bacterium]
MGIDDLDRDIIRALQQNGRRTNVEIARDLGVAESTVRKRLDRLLQDGWVHIVAIPNLGAVGFTVQAMVLLQVELAYVERVANQLASFPQVRTVTYTTGEYALIVEAVFENNEALLHFLSTQVASLPGIDRTTTVHILQEVKACHQWQIPLPPSPTVLIVDDDPDFIEVTRLVLERNGYTVLSAADGDAGVHVLQTQHPDLVILDVMMNSLLEGLSTTQTIRANEDTQSTPILMVSSITSSEYADSFPTDEYVPVDNFVSKPVAPEALLREIQRLLDHRNSPRAQRRPR